MPTRRLAHGRTVARNAHPRLRFSAAPLRHNPAVSVRRAPDLGGRVKSGHLWTPQIRPFRASRDGT